MDHSTRNIENDDTSDKATIKVKVADEEYHDLVIDWSDRSGPHKGQQVFEQLSSITGFPSEYIDFVAINFTPNGSVTIENVEVDETARYYDGFTHENYSEMFNDGDCFAISTSLSISELGDDLNASIYLYCRDMFTDNDCSPHYCHYVNTRAWLNRQVAIVTNAELRMKLKSKLYELSRVRRGANHQTFRQYDLQRTRIFRDLGIGVFALSQRCRAENDPAFFTLHAVSPPDYERNRG